MKRLKRFKRLKERFKAVNTSTKFVVISVLATTIFTVAAFFVLFRTGQNISDGLVAAFFAFWGVENGCLAAIKITKTRKNNDDIERMVKEKYEELISSKEDID